MIPRELCCWPTWVVIVVAQGNGAMGSGPKVTTKEGLLLKRLGRTKKLFAFLRAVRHELFDDAFQAELETMYRETGLVGRQCRPR